MASVTCPGCSTDSPEGQQLCRTCGYELSGVTTPVRRPPPPDRSDRQPEPRADREFRAPDACPSCHTEVADPTNRVCTECLSVFVPREAGGSERPQPRGGEGGTMRLRFLGSGGAAGIVSVSPGEDAPLGRDQRTSPHAALFAGSDNISRLHATVGTDPEGVGWVRDEGSTNGTFVNDRQIRSSETVRLVHGDVVRLASDVVAHVDLDGPP